MTSTNDTSDGKRLTGRVAVVSGGAHGIGRAIAEKFQREGARAVILDCDTPQGELTADELTKQNPNLSVKFIAVDLRNPDRIRDSIAVMTRIHPHVDILVNNAGIEIEKSLHDLTVADWDSILDVNLRGAFLLTQALLPLFPEAGGSIVNIASIHATHAFPNSVPYACSKAGLIALTRNLALELAPRHIRVNCISPGYIDTRLWDEYLRHCENPQDVAEQTAAFHPLGRRGAPADVAEAVLFLASNSAGFATGINLIVDGGLTLRAHP